MAGFRFARVSQVHIIYGVTATAGFFGDTVVTLVHVIDVEATRIGIGTEHQQGCNNYPHFILP